MPELSPTIFGLVVIAVVGLMVIVPRVRARKHHPTQHEMYFGEQTGGSGAPGAPRATSPTRLAETEGAAAESEAPAPLKLPL